MWHYPSAAFNYTIHHVCYPAAGLIECSVGGVANPAFLYHCVCCVCACLCVFECWQEWKTAFILEDVGICVCVCVWDVFGCMSSSVHKRSRGVYKSNQMIVPHSDPLCHSKCISLLSFFFFSASCHHFTCFLSPSFLLLLPPPLLWNRFVWGPPYNLQQCPLLGDGRQILISNWAL